MPHPPTFPLDSDPAGQLGRQLARGLLGSLRGVGKR